MWMIVAICVITIRSTSATNDKCSQYYWTNNLWGKLGSVEMECIKREKKCTALEQQNEQLRGLLKYLNQTFTDSLNSLKHTFTNSDRQQLEAITQLKKENEKFQNSLEDQIMEVKDIRNKLSLLENKTSAVERSLENKSSLIVAEYAFTAMISKYNNYSRGQIIIFDHVITNEGNGYTASTGKFTAPRAGMYVFSVTMQTYQAYYYVDLFKERELIGRIFASDYERPYLHDTSSVTITTRLNQGDAVFATYANGISKQKFSFNYPWYCFFSGFLMS